MNGITMKIFVARTFHNVDGTELICTQVLLASSRTVVFCKKWNSHGKACPFPPLKFCQSFSKFLSSE